MIKWEIDITEIRRLAMLLPRFNDAIEEEVVSAMVESGMMLTALVSAEIAAHSKNTGLLAAAVSYPEGFTVEGEPLGTYTGTVAAANKVGMFGVSTSFYSNFVEFGTRPHTPPLEPLEYWVTRKFGLQGDEARQRAKLVQMSISHRGTRARYHFQHAWKERGGERRVKRIWAEVPRKIIQRWERAS